MKKKRDRLQVIHDILMTIQQKNGKIKPTHILYKSNLSYQMLEEYMSELMEKGLVTESTTKSGKTYSLTQRGYDYLNQYKTIIEFMTSFGLD